MSSEKQAFLLPTQEQPLPAAGTAHTTSRRRGLIPRLAIFSLALYYVHSAGLGSATLEKIKPQPKKPSADLLCPQLPPYEQLNNDLGNLTAPTRQELAGLLSGAVQLDTTVPDNWPPVSEDEERWAKVFDPFAIYLQASYPALHAPGSPVSRTLVNKHGLLYEWTGSDPTLKPLLLMAHQDVVPVEPTTVDQWTYPPFSGHYDEAQGLIYGRGAADTKSSIVGILASVESLLQADWQPKRSLIISFGFDEESSGSQGALQLSRHIEAKYGRDSIAMIVDEGGGIDKPDLNTHTPAFAGPAVNEKGYVDFSIKVKTRGGHSSVPPPHSSIGYLSQILVAVEAHPHTAELDLSNPAWSGLLCYIAYQGGEGKPGLTKAVYQVLELEEKRKALVSPLHSAPANAQPQSLRASLSKTHRKLEKAKRKVLANLSADRRVAFQTTQSVDLIKGGIKVNALPEEAEAVVNHRIAPSSSVDEVQEHVAKVVGKIAKHNDLALEVRGRDGKVLSTSSNPSSKGTVVLSIAFDSGLEPSPSTPLQGEEAKPWRLLQRVIRATWSSGLAAAEGNHTAQPITVGPELMGGNTDTARYWNLTRSIFRFSGGSTLPLPPTCAATRGSTPSTRSRRTMRCCRAGSSTRASSAPPRSRSCSCKYS